MSAYMSKSEESEGDVLEFAYQTFFCGPALCLVRFGGEKGRGLVEVASKQGSSTYLEDVVRLSGEVLRATTHKMIRMKLSLFLDELRARAVADAERDLEEKTNALQVARDALESVKKAKVELEEEEARFLSEAGMKDADVKTAVGRWNAFAVEVQLLEKRLAGAREKLRRLEEDAKAERTACVEVVKERIAHVERDFLREESKVSQLEQEVQSAAAQHEFHHDLFAAFTPDAEETEDEEEEDEFENPATTTASSAAASGASSQHPVYVTTEPLPSAGSKRTSRPSSENENETPAQRPLVSQDSSSPPPKKKQTKPRFSVQETAAVLNALPGLAPHSTITLDNVRAAMEEHEDLADGEEERIYRRCKYIANGMSIETFQKHFEDAKEEGIDMRPWARGMSRSKLQELLGEANADELFRPDSPMSSSSSSSSSSSVSILFGGGAAAAPPKNIPSKESQQRTRLEDTPSRSRRAS